MTAFDNLQDRLDPPKRGDTHFMALCPAHPDRNPSLRVTAIPGSVLIHCFAGCDTDTVLHTMGLDRASLFDNPTGRAYEYEDGRVVHRTPDKKFRQTGNTTGTPTLYRLSDVQAAVACGSVVYLVEGEKDADAIAYHWQRCATTTPMGANGITKAHIAPLKGANIILVPDMDRAGETWLQAAQALLAPIAATLTVKQPAHGKDVSDHIAAGGTETTLIEPPEPEVAYIHPLVDWDDIWAQEWRPDWIAYPFIHAACASALFASAGIGKSLFALEMAIAIANGRAFMGEVLKPRRVLYVDFENDPLVHIRPRVTAMGYTNVEMRNVPYMSFPQFGAFDEMQGAQQLLRHVDHYQPELVIIDTLGRTLSGDENDAKTIQAFYRQVGMPLKQRKTAYMRIDHGGKDMTRGSRGTSAKRDDLDLEWAMAKDCTCTERRCDCNVFELTCEKDRIPVGRKDLKIALERSENPLRHCIRDVPTKSDAEEAKEAIQAIPGWQHMGVRELTRNYRELGGRMRDTKLREVIRTLKPGL